MNEIKRQLDKKMGNTSQRVERVMNNVNQNKRQIKNKKSSHKLYYVTLAGFVAILALIAIIINPFSTKPSNQASPQPSTPTDVIEQPNVTETLKKFFKQDGDVAYFLGTGNEYASFTETTAWLAENHVQILEDNSGAISQKIYRITNEAIELVYEGVEDSDAKEFTEAELQNLEVIQTILQWPLEDGIVMEGKLVVLPVEKETPYKTFTNAVQITEVIEGGKNLFYYVEGYGLVARVFESNDGYQVSSYLASINEPPASTSNESVSFLNIDTNEQEQLPLSMLPFIDPLENYSTIDASFELTYETLFTTDKGDFGVFHYYCGDYNCSLSFVLRNDDTITTGPNVFGSISSFKRSPNKEKVMIAMRYLEPIEDGLVERSMLQIMNPETMEMEVPTSHEIYFSKQLYPITHYDWVDDTTVQAEVADIEDTEANTIYNWQNGDKSTKVIEAHLP